MKNNHLLFGMCKDFWSQDNRALDLQRSITEHIAYQYYSATRNLEADSTKKTALLASSLTVA